MSRAGRGGEAPIIMKKRLYAWFHFDRRHTSRGPESRALGRVLFQGIARSPQFARATISKKKFRLRKRGLRLRH